jgi:hypothetical protein
MKYLMALLSFISLSISAVAQEKAPAEKSQNASLIAEDTHFGKSAGEYAELLSSLQSVLITARETFLDTLQGRPRNVFVPWIRDHVHVMKAMKYLHPDMTSFLEFFLENQTSEGIYFDYYFPLSVKGIARRMELFDKRYWTILEEDSLQLHRLPVEADLEYLMVEGVYAVWQSTGDTSFVKKWLPALVKGMNYLMTDPLRWSAKYQLVKRGYTLDTWDFMQLPTSREEYTRSGKDVQEGIFDIDKNTPMGIMHGDNSGMFAASNQLSELFAAIGDAQQSKVWANHANSFRVRTNAVCWNGKYYAHFVEDDPQPSYLKMDQKNTLSLSNPYDINRGLPTEEMAQSIIKTYKDLKEFNKANSFAEWYGVYPAVEPHFADYLPGSYMNGGVNTIVAGELAKAAFQHGYEAYGVDILNRINDLFKKHNGDLPVAYTPQGKVDEGIPDNWGQAAVYSAMIEGLAGVVDKSNLFKEVEVSPRWLAAGKDQAEVNIAYKPTGKKVSYKYVHDVPAKKIKLTMSGDMKKSTIRILLPPKYREGKAFINGKSHASKVEKINASYYLVMNNVKGSAVDAEVRY